MHLLDWIQPHGYFTSIKAGIKNYKKTDTMKVVAGNSTTRNMNPSDIFESGFYFSDVKTHQL